MSTAIQEQIRTQTVNIAPVPCRMIRIQVFSDTGNSEKPWGISWAHVIGIMCAPSLEFPTRMDVWPVVVGDDAWEGELCVVDEHYDPANLKYKACVPCFWPPEQDEENAIRIGKTLIAKDGEIGTWVSVSADTPNA